nr:hypothetical protein [Tanacetum cinerariifolium]
GRSACMRGTIIISIIIIIVEMRRGWLNRKQMKKKWSDDLFSCHNPFGSFALVERGGGLGGSHGSKRKMKRMMVKRMREPTLFPQESSKTSKFANA